MSLPHHSQIYTENPAKLWTIDSRTNNTAKSGVSGYLGVRWCYNVVQTSPAGSLLVVKLHSENEVILNGNYEILISLILQWQDNTKQTMRNQLSLIIGQRGLTINHDALDMLKLS